MQDVASRWIAAAVGCLHDYGLLAPLMQLLLAALIGFFFAERWQRWRQRRDFQYRTLVKFAELSFDLMDRLSELLVTRGRMNQEAYMEKRREMVSRWTAFASMRPEVMACYGRDFLHTVTTRGCSTRSTHSGRTYERRSRCLKRTSSPSRRSSWRIVRPLLRRWCV